MRDYDLVIKHDDLAHVAQCIASASIIGLDIETCKLPNGKSRDALEPRRGRIRLVQLNLDDMWIFVIDLFRTKGLGPIEQALRDTKAILVIHGAKFEQKWFWQKYRMNLWPVFCTHRASALIYNGQTHLKHNIDAVVERELGEIVDNTGEGASDWSRPQLSKHQLDYAAEDVIRLLRLRKELREKLDYYGLMYTALIEFGVILSESAAELNGFPVDRDMWVKLAAEKVIERARLKEELLYDLPHPENQLALPGMNGSWNLDSNPLMLKSLRKLGLKSKDDDGHVVSLIDTANLTLAPHAAAHDEVAKLMEYRHVAQRVKTFGLKWLKDLEDDGRVHTNYWALLVSGRYSSAHPNIQQIPRELEFRGCFRAPNGRVFVLADYAGIEMRIIAEVANDGKLIRVFIENQDAHYATASLVMNKPISQITKAERQQAKAVNFGFIYGMQPKKFVVYALGNYGVRLSLGEARKFHSRYFENYEGIRVWHGRVTREGKRSGISRTLSGRHRYLDRHKSWNEFMNNPIQGTGADGLKLAMRNVHQRLLHPKYGDRAWLVHHIHDEIIVECDDDEETIMSVKRDLEEGMIEGMSPFLKKVPIVVDANHGRSWADAK